MALLSPRSFVNKRKQQGETVILKALGCLQGARYIELAEKREQNEAFVIGWLANRVKTGSRYSMYVVFDGVKKRGK